MEATENDGNNDVRWKSDVFQLETNDVRIGEERMMQADRVLKSLSPLINCMRPFGLYFTRIKPRVGCETTLQRRVGRCQDWNFARVYATVILVVVWLTAIRYATLFDGTEKLGAALFMKLGMIPAAFLGIILQTSYYCASHTGRLDRVFRQASLSTVEPSPKYARRTKTVVVVVWILLAWNVFHYVYQLFNGGRLNDVALIFLSKTLPESCLYVVKAVSIVLYLQTIGTWCFPQAMKSALFSSFLILSIQFITKRTFPQAMNYMVMVVLCDQFRLLNNEFGKCIGDRGQFSGNFEQFRRRHQAISRSVQEADRFLMTTSGANFCCQIISIILVLYSIIFYRDDTIALDAESAVMYIAWFLFSVFGLSLIAGQAIMLNHMASIS